VQACTKLRLVAVARQAKSVHALDVHCVITCFSHKHLARESCSVRVHMLLLEFHGVHVFQYACVSCVWLLPGWKSLAQSTETAAVKAFTFSYFPSMMNSAEIDPALVWLQHQHQCENMNKELLRWVTQCSLQHDSCGIDQVLVTMSNDVVAHCAWFSTQFLALIHVLVIVNASQTHKAICWKRLLTWMTSTLRASASLYTSVRHRRLEWNLLIIHLMKAYRSYTTARLLSISIPDATASAERECRQWEQKKKHFREFDF